jgi:hypothetical protein
MLWCIFSLIETVLRMSGSSEFNARPANIDLRPNGYAGFKNRFVELTLRWTRPISGFAKCSSQTQGRLSGNSQIG